MLIIVGIAVVLISVAIGFAMVNGPFGTLIQPSEYVVIGGAVIGATIASNPMKYLMQILGKLPLALKGSIYTKTSYSEVLRMQYDVFVNSKKNGLLSIEEDVNNPHSFSLFTKYPTFVANHHAVDFFCDAMKMLVNGACSAEELEMMLEAELETHHEEAAIVPALLQRASDALPGLGIVAAVLGIVVTMQHIDGPPEEIGHHVAAALVGTFLGLLLSYGMVSPISTHIENLGHDEAKYFNCLKAGIVAYANGAAPSTAIEFSRKTILSFERPPLSELEPMLKEIKPR
ncbi:MAG: flagellar motor stator protein MotA [Acidobacteriota bacterium]